jgi:hypothetical protein
MFGICYRRKQKLDTFAGWHLNRLETEYTVRSPMCGHSGSWVSSFSQFFCYLLFSSLSFPLIGLMKSDWFEWNLFFWFFLNGVWEIITRCTPHLNLDIYNAAIQIRWVNCVCLFSNHLHFLLFFFLGIWKCLICWIEMFCVDVCVCGVCLQRQRIDTKDTRTLSTSASRTDATVLEISTWRTPCIFHYNKKMTRNSFPFSLSPHTSFCLCW